MPPRKKSSGASASYKCKDPLEDYISQTLASIPKTLPSSSSSTEDGTVDTIALRKDIKNPSNSYQPSSFWYNGDGFWPDVDVEWYRDTLFGQISAYGKLHPAEEYQQADVDDIIYRLEQSKHEREVEETELELPKRNSTSRLLTHPSPSFKLTPLLLHSSTLSSKTPTAGQEPHPLLDDQATSSQEVIISSFTRQEEEEEECRSSSLCLSPPSPRSPTAIPASSMDPNNHMPATPPEILDMHYNGDPLIFTVPLEKTLKTPSPPKNTLLGTLNSLAYLHPSKAFDDRHEAGPLSPPQPANKETQTAEIPIVASSVHHTPDRSVRRAEVFAAFPIEVHARYFLSAGKLRPRAKSSPLRTKTEDRSRSTSLPPKGKSPFLFRCLGDSPSPCSKDFVIIPPADDQPSCTPASLIETQSMDKDLDEPNALDVLADIADRQVYAEGPSRHAGLTSNAAIPPTPRSSTLITGGASLSRLVQGIPSSAMSRDGWAPPDSGISLSSKRCQAKEDDGKLRAARAPEGQVPSPGEVDVMRRGSPTLSVKVRPIFRDITNRDERMRTTIDDKGAVLAAIEQEKEREKDAVELRPIPVKAVSGGQLAPNEPNKEPPCGGMRVEDGMDGLSLQETIERCSKKRSLQEMVEGKGELYESSDNGTEMDEKDTLHPGHRIRAGQPQAKRPRATSSEVRRLQAGDEETRQNLKDFVHVPRVCGRPQYYAELSSSSQPSSRNNLTLHQAMYDSTRHSTRGRNRGREQGHCSTTTSTRTSPPSGRSKLTITPIEHIGRDPQPTADSDDDNDADVEEAEEIETPRGSGRRGNGRWEMWCDEEEEILLETWDQKGGIGNQVLEDLRRALNLRGYERTPQAIKYRCINRLRKRLA